MDPAKPARANSFLYPFDTCGNLVRRLHMIHLHIDHAEAERDPRIHFLQCVQVLRRTMREFQNNVIRMKTVEEPEQGLPLALLDHLSAVIAETQMNCLLTFE